MRTTRVKFFEVFADPKVKEQDLVPPPFPTVAGRFGSDEALTNARRKIEESGFIVRALSFSATEPVMLAYVRRKPVK